MDEGVPYFVNRHEIIASFRRMLGGDSAKQIMLVKADKGMGKTSLINKLKHECSRTRPRTLCTKIDFLDPWLKNFLAVVHLARDDLGAAYFNHTTEVIKRALEYTINLNVSTVAPQRVETQFGDVSESTVNVSGLSVLNDSYVDLRLPSGGSRNDIEAQISRAFIDDLKAFLTQQPAVFFFDNYELAPEMSAAGLSGNYWVQCEMERCLALMWW
jgi:predicted ATPase